MGERSTTEVRRARERTARLAREADNALATSGALARWERAVKAVTDAAVAPLVAELEVLREENRRLKAGLERSGRWSTPEPQVQRQTSVALAETYSSDPLHDDAVVKLIMAGSPPGSPEVKQAIRVANQRNLRAAWTAQGQPAGGGEEQQLRELALQSLQMARTGSTVKQIEAAGLSRFAEDAVNYARSERAGGLDDLTALGRSQVPTNYRARGRECVNGHAVDDDSADECRYCGGRVKDRSESFVRPLPDPATAVPGSPNPGPPLQRKVPLAAPPCDHSGVPAGARYCWDCAAPMPAGASA